MSATDAQTVSALPLGGATHYSSPPAIYERVQEPIATTNQGEYSFNAADLRGTEVTKYLLTFKRYEPVKLRVAQPGDYTRNDLQSLKQAVRETKKLLELEDGWDDCGAAKLSKSTWTRATDFIVRHANYCFDNFSKTIIPTPRVTACRDGSIDVRWKTKNIDILVNFPEDSGELAEFYAEDGQGLYGKGTFAPTRVSLSLVEWLIKK